MRMKRRQFLGAMGTSALAFGNLTSLQAVDAPADIKITRIVRFDLVSQRSKVAGKNSRLDVHGDQATDAMVRIFTNADVEGIVFCRAAKQDLARLLGEDPLSLLQREAPSIVAPIGSGTMPLWDLCGRILQKPVYELLGGKGPAQVPVYDGSIYFADLLPEHSKDPMARFRAEVQMAIAMGHQAVKVKIGRGAKWMSRAEGDARDLEVVRTIRDEGGPDLIIGVDANNGYDLPGAKRWIDETAELKLAFVEELFPEAIEPCLELKEHIRSRGLETLLADGETQQTLEPLKPLIDAHAIDVLQGDMNHFGPEGILREAGWAAAAGSLVAPHNWGSWIGYYMQLHIGRAIGNFYRAEHDPLTNDVVRADGYTIEGGLAKVPDAPGFGFVVEEEHFRSKAKIRFDLQT